MYLMHFVQPSTPMVAFFFQCVGSPFTARKVNLAKCVSTRQMSAGENSDSRTARCVRVCVLLRSKDRATPSYPPPPRESGTAQKNHGVCMRELAIRAHQRYIYNASWLEMWVFFENS